YPIVYDFEDPAEQIDWDDASRFDGFLENVRRISPTAFTPFASMFCFLSDELFSLNDKIVTPEGLIARARAGEVSAAALPMNPGDRWSSATGHEVMNHIAWSQKQVLLRAYASAARPELDRLRRAEVVPGGRAALAAAFAAWFDAYLARLPFLLRRRLDLCVRFDVEG